MYAGSITSNPVTPSVNMKNRLINSAMVIDQRNAGASVSTSSGSSIYTVDRFRVDYSATSKMTAQQSSTVPTGFINSLLITSSSAYSVGASDYFVLQQAIEGFNTADLDFGKATAKTITLSFWVRSSLTGTFGGNVRNSDNTRCYPFSYTISSANTFEQKSITIAGDTTGTWLTTNGAGMFVTWGLGVGSTLSGTAGSWGSTLYLSATGATSVVGTNGATFYFTGVQLEVGSTATSFDYRPYGTELALCQRYCYLTGGSEYSNFFSGVFATASDFQGPVIFPVTMRSAPTLTTSGNFQVLSNSVYSATGLNLGASETTKMTAKINSTVSSGTAGYGGTMRAANDTTAKLILSAEL
jgi:hypothetical protein